MAWPAMQERTPDDPLGWEVKWLESSSETQIIKSTACYCEQSQLDLTREVFRSSSLSLKNKRDPIAETPSPSRQIATPKMTTNYGTLSQGIIKGRPYETILSAQSPRSVPSTHGDVPSTPTLDKLPYEILDQILKYVYITVTRSRNLCHCSRPKTSYETVKEVALEHLIVNTMALRETCSTFHAWAHKEILRSREEQPLQIDFSNFEGMHRRRAMATNSVGGSSDAPKPGFIAQLAKDFPGLAEFGISIYLGCPGNSSNMKALCEMLRAHPNNVFSGIILWDLDYSYVHKSSISKDTILLIAQCIRTLEFKDSLPSELEDAVLSNTIEGFRANQYSFFDLITGLGHARISQLHLPVHSLIGLSTKFHREKTIAALLSTHNSVVFRDIIYKDDILKESDIESHLELSQSISTLGKLPHYIYVRYIYWLRGDIVMLFREYVKEAWIEAVGSVAASGLLDANSLEFWLVGERYMDQSERMIFWPRLRDVNFSMFCMIFRGMRSVTFRSQTNGGLIDPERRRATSTLQAGAILNALRFKDGCLIKLVDYRSQPAELDKSDPDHACKLLEEYWRLEDLELETRVCLDIFKQREPPSYAGYIPRRRKWVLRILDRAGQPGRCSSKDIREPLNSASPSHHTNLSGNPSQREGDTWTPADFQTLLQNCRDWRDRFESLARYPLDWNVEIHMTRYRDDSSEVQNHYRHDLLFTPLARPPMIEMTVIDRSGTTSSVVTIEEENDSSFQRGWELEFPTQNNGGDEDEEEG